MYNTIVNYFANLPMWEWAAVITALLYVYFAAKENILCWPMALISTAIYTAIFYDVYLWMDSILQVYYFAMAIYGWYCWQSLRKTNTLNTSQDPNITGIQADNKLMIQSWGLNFHVKAIIALSLVSVVLGYVMANYTPTSFPYVDAATTVFAVFATYLVTQKVIENWHYWLVIDAVSIYIYIQKGLAPTAFLFSLYIIFVVYGYFSWRQKLQNQMNSGGANQSHVQLADDSSVAESAK